MAEEGKPQLIPPSAFAVAQTSSEDPWKTIKKIKEELVALRKKNEELQLEKENLKIAKAPAIEEIKAHINLHHENFPPIPPRSPRDYQHVNEIISRQATDIAELRLHVDQVKQEYRDKTDRYECELIDRCNNITELEKKMKFNNEKSSKEEEALRCVIETDKANYMANIAKLHSQLEANDKLMKNKDTEHHFEMKRLQEETSWTVQKLNIDLSTKNTELKDVKRQLEQLKTYMGNIIDEKTQCDSWMKEKVKLENNVEELELTRECLTKTNQLLNVRLSALNEILAIQEKELLKSGSEFIDPTNKTECLLTRWREKVFALMVQLKSADITMTKDVNNYKLKLKAIEEQLTSAKNEKIKLHHELRDKEAELAIEKNNIKSLELELTRAQQIALTLDDRAQDDEQKMTLLYQLVVRLVNTFNDISEKLRLSDDKLKSYNQRVTFASKRVAVLQSQMLRRETLNRLKSKDDISTKVITSLEEQPVRLIEKVGDDINVELEKVIAERDQFAAQIRQDSELLESKIQEAHDAYAVKMTEMESDLCKIQQLLQEKNEKIINIQSLLDEKEAELLEKKNLIDRLEKNIATQQKNFDKLLEDRDRNAEDELEKKLFEMEKSLNEARREHAKAVVSARQSERQLQREKERTIEREEATEKRQKQEIEKLTNQLRSIEKERNILMSTLRQEGLLKKVRPLPISSSELSQPSETAADPSKTEHPQQKTQAQTGSKPTVQDLLEDLKTLTTETDEEL